MYMWPPLQEPHLSPLRLPVPPARRSRMAPPAPNLCPGFGCGDLCPQLQLTSGRNGLDGTSSAQTDDRQAHSCPARSPAPVRRKQCTATGEVTGRMNGHHGTSVTTVFNHMSSLMTHRTPVQNTFQSLKGKIRGSDVGGRGN